MIIGESTARHFFGAGNPIGKTIGLDRIGAPGKSKDVYEVIGIAKDSDYSRIGEKTVRTAYLASGSG